MSGKVKYEVLAPAFINGTLYRPIVGQRVFLEAPPGHESAALKLVEPEPAALPLAPETTPASPPDAPAAKAGKRG